jgi:hypothetical protein
VLDIAAGHAKESLAAELSEVVRNGLGRPLPQGTSDAGVAAVLELATEISESPTAPPSLRIAEAIRKAIGRLFPPSHKQAAAILFATDLSIALDDPAHSFETKKLEVRRETAAEALGVPWSSYRRTPGKYERPLLLEVAEQLIVSAAERSLASSARGAEDRPDAATGDLLQQHAECSAALHYGILACLFVNEFSRRATRQRDRGDTAPHLVPFSTPLFRRYLRFALSQWACQEDEGTVRPPSRVSATAVRIALKIGNDILTKGPGPLPVDRYELLMYLQPPDDPALLIAVPKVDEYHDGRWQSWLQRESSQPPFYVHFGSGVMHVQPSSLTLLAKSLNEIVALVEESKGHPLPAAGRAEASVIRDVVAYFDDYSSSKVDESALIETLTYYFERIQGKLEGRLIL